MNILIQVSLSKTKQQELDKTVSHWWTIQHNSSAWLLIFLVLITIPWLRMKKDSNSLEFLLELVISHLLRLIVNQRIPCLKNLHISEACSVSEEIKVAWKHEYFLKICERLKGLKPRNMHKHILCILGKWVWKLGEMRNTIYTQYRKFPHGKKKSETLAKDETGIQVEFREMQ